MDNDNLSKLKNIVNTLEINESMVASLIYVTPRALFMWFKGNFTVADDPRVIRLINLSNIVDMFKDRGVNGKIMLNYINDPIPGFLDGRSLLGCLEYTDSDQLMQFVDNVLKDYSDTIYQ